MFSRPGTLQPEIVCLFDYHVLIDPGLSWPWLLFRWVSTHTHTNAHTDTHKQTHAHTQTHINKNTHTHTCMASAHPQTYSWIKATAAETLAPRMAKHLSNSDPRTRPHWFLGTDGSCCTARPTTIISVWTGTAHFTQYLIMEGLNAKNRYTWTAPFRTLCNIANCVHPQHRSDLWSHVRNMPRLSSRFWTCTGFSKCVKNCMAFSNFASSMPIRK